MKIKAALLATAASGAFLVIAACGGGGGGGSSQSPPASQPQQSQSGGQAPPSDAPTQYIAIDLQPNGDTSSAALGIGEAEQVGDSGLASHPQDSVFPNHAVLWRGSSSSVVDLTPNKSFGFVTSFAAATSGGIQVGGGGLGPVKDGQTATTHALKWSGSAGSAVDLNPSGFDFSVANGVAGDQIVGSGSVSTPGGFGGFHALLWTSRGVVDLHPSGFINSGAAATDGGQQVGGGELVVGAGLNARGVSHALLWRGTADSVVDLHPASGYNSSNATGVGGGQQVGVGSVFDPVSTALVPHALLWAGSAGSVVDLHPSGFVNSRASGVAGGRQVGSGQTAGGSFHALVWNGTAASMVDLHAFLPKSFSDSQANGIDASGNIVGTADGHAILWVPQR